MVELDCLLLFSAMLPLPMTSNISNALKLLHREAVEDQKLEVGAHKLRHEVRAPL